MMLRCQGCADLLEESELNGHKVTNGRYVRYCDRCDALRDQYGIRREEHEQYCLPQLADQLARAPDGTTDFEVGPDQ